MIKEMTAAELNADCRTYVALKASDMQMTKAMLERRYSRVELDEAGEYIRVYDAVYPEDIVVYLYQQCNILVSEIKTAKISLEEYYIDLMNRGRETRWN